MKYTINTADICTQGFERLRTQEEILLGASVYRGVTAEDIMDEITGYVDNVMWLDDFGYEACLSVVRNFITDNWRWIEAAATEIDPPSEDDYEGGAELFLYVQQIPD